MSRPLPPILDELRGMAVFATVVRCGSFAAAARALGLTRAVVSHHVRVLENRVGVPLAQRSTRSFSLTPAGAAFRVHCERLLDEAHDRCTRPGEPVGWLLASTAYAARRLQEEPA